MLGLNVWGNECATTMTFMTISFAELFQAFNVRSERGSAFKNFFTNKILLATVAAGVILNVLLCVTPLSAAFGLVKLDGMQWLTVALVSVSVVPAGELYKVVLRAVTRRKSRYFKHTAGATPRKKAAAEG